MPTLKMLPSADAFIENYAGKRDTNYNTAVLEVKSTGGVRRFSSMLKFSLASLPADAVISAASLYMYCGQHNLAVVGNVCRTADGWIERGVTWNNAPAAGASIGNFTAGLGWKSVNVSSYVQGQWTGDKVVSFRIRASATSSPWAGQRYDSREGANKPYLAITYETITAAFACPHCPATFVSQAELDAHIASAHPPIYSCPHCPATFGSQAELDAHILTEHPTNGNGIPASIPMIAWPVGFGACNPTTLKSFTDLGINALMIYTHWWADGFATNPAYVTWLNERFDYAATAGVKLYVFIDNRAGAYKGLYTLSADDKKPFITKFKDKPAVAGWFIADEPHCWDGPDGFPGYTMPEGDKKYFPYLKVFSWPATGHGLAKMLYDMIRGQDPDIVNHPAFSVWEKGFMWQCYGAGVWTSQYETIYTPGGEIFDVGCVDIYPDGDWGTLDHWINVSYAFSNHDGFGELGKGMIPVIQVFPPGALVGENNLLNQCLRWEAKYTRAMIRGIGFYTADEWLKNTSEGANLREQIKDVCRHYGWRETPDEVVTTKSILHECEAVIEYRYSSIAGNNVDLTCPYDSQPLGVRGIAGSEMIKDVSRIIERVRTEIAQLVMDIANLQAQITTVQAEIDEIRNLLNI